LDFDISNIMNSLWHNEEVVNDEPVFRIISNLNSSAASRQSKKMEVPQEWNESSQKDSNEISCVLSTVKKPIKEEVIGELTL